MDWDRRMPAFPSLPPFSKCPWVFPPAMLPLHLQYWSLPSTPGNNSITYTNSLESSLSSRVPILILQFPSYGLQVLYHFTFLSVFKNIGRAFCSKKKSKGAESSMFLLLLKLYFLVRYSWRESIHFHLPLAPWFSLETQHCLEYWGPQVVQPNGFNLTQATIT